MKAAPAEATEAAETLQRLAVLLEAGVAPAQAWSLLAEDGDATALRLLGDAAPDDGGGEAEGVPPPQHHPLLDPTENMDRLGGAWTDVAVAWRVAQTVGAPLAPSLRQFAGALRSAAEMRDDVAVALADPRATARLVAWLPALAILLGVALGFDVAAVLVHPVGIGCIATGAALMLAARLWTARLVARAEPDRRLAGLQSEIVAIALSGGVSVERALAVTTAAGAGEIEADVHAMLRLSRRAGARAVELLRADAAEQRRRARTDGRLRAARLSSRLLLPMGVCTLPAFLLLGVAPLLISVLSGSTPLLTSAGSPAA
ncbi:pilus assembly protein TadB [Microbacterium laevaniformans]|uniref:type II secretion system F family protein n=1 Tax=Microbacterium laevaniformans TaxID=36807 RepID=UPI003D95A5A5